MAIVGIHLSEAFDRIGRWDGERLGVGRFAAADVARQWEDRAKAVGLVAGDSVVLFSRRDGRHGEIDRICELVSNWGVGDVRVIEPAVDDEPGIAAMVEVMRMERLASAMTIECEGRFIQCGWIERGAPIGVRNCRIEGEDDGERVAAASGLIRGLLDSRLGSSDVDGGRPAALIAFGAEGPRIARAVASATGIENVIIPPHAEDLSAVGLLLMDTVLTFRCELAEELPTGESLRETYRGLMDEGGRAVILRGFDFDDTVVDPFVEVRAIGGGEPRLVAIESLGDSSSIADAYGGGVVSAAVIRVRIETEKPPVLAAPFEVIR